MGRVIGLDVGTTSTIGVLIDVEGRVLASADRPTRLSSLKAGWAEEDPDEWWGNACAVIGELLARARIGADGVDAVAVAGMLPAVVLRDREGRLLRPSIQQSDGRCAREVEALRRAVDEDAFLRRAGNGVNQQLVAPKLRWLEREEPEVFGRIATVCGAYDDVNARLTGERRVERNWALEAGFVDLADGRLAPDLIALGGVDAAAVPPLARSDEIVGEVSAGAARLTGLRAGTPITGGAADHIASAFAAGVAEPGDVLLKFGGAADIMVASEAARPDPRLFLDYHLRPGLFMPNGCMASGGSALNWFVDRVAIGSRARAEAEGLSPHAWLDRLAAKTPPGADGVEALPYFLGEKTPLHDAAARGVFIGLSFNHGVEHLWRALLEAFAYAFRHHVETLREIGHPTRRFLASDGGSRSQLWMQITADVLQEEVRLLIGHPGSCLGAAWTAVVAAGLDDDWSGLSRFVTPGEAVAPRPDMAALYEEGYARFRELHGRLRPMTGERTR